MILIETFTAGTTKLHVVRVGYCDYRVLEVRNADNKKGSFIAGFEYCHHALAFCLMVVRRTVELKDGRMRANYHVTRRIRKRQGGQ